MFPVFLFRMVCGTRANPDRGDGHEDDVEPPPPPRPSMAQVLATVEANRVRTEQLLELVAQNMNRPAQCVTLVDFLRAQPPFFSNPEEPLDADD